MSNNEIEDNLSIVWFSQIEDYRALESSIRCSLLSLPNAKKIVSLGDPEKIYLDIENVDFVHSGFDQNKLTGGIDLVVGELEFFYKVYKKTNRKFILKQDSDILCLNNYFIHDIDEEYVIHGQYASKNFSPYMYGGCYLINCSKINFKNIKQQLLDLDNKHNNIFSKNNWPEDFTIYFLCNEFGENKLFKKGNNSWMKFWEYKIHLIDCVSNSLSIHDHIFNSFVNFGYYFSNKEERDYIMKYFSICYLDSKEEVVESIITEIPIDYEN